MYPDSMSLERRLTEIFRDPAVHCQRILSQKTTQELLTIIRSELMIFPKITVQNPLSLREMLCLLLLAVGKNPARCGDILNLSYNSVATYETRIRKKLNAKTRTHALFIALQNGYFEILK